MSSLTPPPSSLLVGQPAADDDGHVDAAARDVSAPPTRLPRSPQPDPPVSAVLATSTISAASAASAASASSAVPAPPSPASPASPSLLPDRPASPDLPLTMTASTVLLNLPRDATAALAAATGAAAFAKDKVVVRFKAVGSAPPLLSGAAGKNGGSSGGEVRRKISATQKFEVVVAFVRRALRVRPTESVFLYVNSAFAPALDEVVGNLHQCFRDASDQLNVSYSLTPAFG